MKKNRLFGFSILLAMVLTGCAQETATPTPTAISGVGNAAVELIQQDMYIRLTEKAIEGQRIETSAKMTATQQVMDATATQQRFVAEVQSTRRAEAATQQAWEVTVQAGVARDEATKQAAVIQATATAEYRVAATQQAIQVSTEKAHADATAASDKKTEQAPIVAAQLKALEIETSKAQMELEKAQATKWFSAWGGWIVAACVMGAAAFVLWKKSKMGTVSADENGNYPLVNIEVDGEWRMTKPANMEGPTIEFRKNNTSMPQLVAPEIQRQTTHGAQVVDAISKLPPGYPRQAMGMTAGLTPNTGAVNINVVQPGTVQGWLQDVQGQLSERVEEDA